MQVRATRPWDPGRPVSQKAFATQPEGRDGAHIKESYEDRSVSTDEAEERAARTVNQTRAEKGETKAARSKSRSSKKKS